MQIKPTNLAGLLVIIPEPILDNRGYFAEIYRQNALQEISGNINFVQINQTGSRAGVVRGLHFQWDPPLGKLIRVISGKAFVVAVDIRKNSKTLGVWHGEELTAENKIAIYAPPGFAAGFCVTGSSATVLYHYTAYYNANGESNILWSDPDIGIDWPLLESPILSERDAKAQTLKEWLARPESDCFNL